MLTKLKNKKAFTLMEMLIVVAIIAILVAIAIPTFASALNKARAATDVANIRSGYASAQIAAMTEDVAAGDYYLLNDGSVAKKDTNVPANAYTCKGASSHAQNALIAGQFTAGATTNGVTWTKDQHIVYTVGNNATGDTDKVTAIKAE